MIASFPKLIKFILMQLCPHDYPLLNSRLFFEIWLTFVLDKGLTSMRDLFYRSKFQHSMAVNCSISFGTYN